MLYRIHWLNGYLGLGAPKWIYENWMRSLHQNGDECFFYENFHSLCSMVDNLSHHNNVIIFDFALVPFDDSTLFKKIKKWKDLGIIVLSTAYWPHERNDKEVLRFIQNENISFFFGERELNSMQEFQKITTAPYFVIPNSFDPFIYKYDESAPSFQYDVSFVGSKLPKKKWFNSIIVPKLKNKYKVFLAGPNWDLHDSILRSFSFSLRKVKLPSAARLIDQMRITLTEEQEALLYKSTKLNLNFHERSNDLSQVNHLVNQRVFKIAGSGGLQLCDRVIAISDYFPNKEILTAELDEASWFEIIKDVVSNPSKYNEKRIQAMKTAHRYHTFQERVRRLIDLIDKKKK